VALDRQSIERKDFPIGRRGYEPDAVDAHLTALAVEVEDLRRSSRRRNESLAAAASEQVRSIVEAAETSAAEIQRQAEAEAVDIHSEATTEARATREHATAQAREYVGNVSGSTSTMLERLDAMQSELGALFDALRTGSNRLNADLQLLETNLDEVRDAVGPRPRFEPESRSVTPPREFETEPSPAQRFDDHAELEPESAKDQGDALAEAQSVAEPGVPGAGTEDAEGARLVALNMALNGTPREETERYLAENFRLSDRRELLDDVYAAVDG
jgi:vacuolar-type H+-ATPase subunit H